MSLDSSLRLFDDLFFSFNIDIYIFHKHFICLSSINFRTNSSLALNETGEPSKGTYDKQ